MTNLLTNLPHMLMATVVIAAATALGLAGTIPGSDVIVLISAAAGITLGGSVSVAGVAAGAAAVAPPAQPEQAKAAPTAAATTPPVA
jgi:hypothetical protein